jgi:hypothetical protein
MELGHPQKFYQVILIEDESIICKFKRNIKKEFDIVTAAQLN